jgi:hypothetical protein
VPRNARKNAHSPADLRGRRVLRDHQAARAGQVILGAFPAPGYGALPGGRL